ncbi:hypothetical protein [Sphaerochaeta halotolerans]|nr:hypothetical protein [Sphaerochaeta halotolerans]
MSNSCAKALNAFLSNFVDNGGNRTKVGAIIKGMGTPTTFFVAK